MTAALSAADIRAVLNGVMELLDLADPALLPAATLGLVTTLVGCESASHNTIDLVRGHAEIHTTGLEPDPESAAAFAAHAGENPLVAHQHATGDLSPVRLSDFITSRQFRRRPIYDLVYRGLGIESQLAFGVLGAPGQVVGIALNRGRHDFSERDAALLALLRPLLDQIRAGMAIVHPRRDLAERLTPRQRQVLTLLAGGATNAQIAYELQISVKTVGKHLENVYEALGVANRTAAAARWLSAHVRDSPY